MTCGDKKLAITHPDEHKEPLSLFPKRFFVFGE